MYSAGGSVGGYFQEISRLIRRTLTNLKRIELERRKQEIEREKDELKQFYSEAFECSTHSVNHDPNFLQLLDDVVVSIFLSKLRFP